MAHTDDRPASEREPLHQRTAPEAAPMVVGRASERPSRRRSTLGIAMLVAGIAAVAVGLIGLGSRMLPTARAVRDTTLDPMATFFMGTAGSTGELVLVIVLIALVPVGIVLGWLGYRRLVDDGPSLAAMHQSNSPNAIINLGGPGGSY
ncbi:hypothetical protein [Agrococcus sp. Marseille-P2731]|uniref:hypothetical protein n=1 Tax=Agrococcus sp. Marseille-P2731 TaxID=1841862 RepID=UPI0009306FD9|nr:hypothetical protein [Agrococcus sp. Marseille-P2731]